ncbi:uncharacterized protein SAPINGB_P006246 [Magnusiomyces paraingens]|uniref:Transmembrane protein 14 n=1 Tax=Magnusiomyces paraingens TaxID=2606893 RepID=A0A5E8C549_9ASCO|nr:uncharacterized protein SAPINGB_P006246 [Saprochaete ingens]VVT58512.1 unnamed protein product [Saprochaete ingens]
MEHPAFTMSALCTIGGLAGYIRRKSLPSLIGGVSTGIVFGAAGILLKRNADWGLELALLGSLLLGGASLPRAIKLQKPVPIGLSVLAGVNLVYYSKKYYDFYA